MIGTAVAFFTPLGSIPQMIGSIGFLLTTATSKLEDGQMGLYWGAGAAIIGSFFVILSLAVPIGIGYSPDQRWGISGRLLTWSVFRRMGRAPSVAEPCRIESEDMQDLEEPSESE